METKFTPFTSLTGGALIGFSAVILMISHGRIAGISSIISRILPPFIDSTELPQSLIFILGLFLAAPLWFLIQGEIPVQVVSDNYILLGIAGLFVGFGSVSGNVCTSGHGVCGISRVSGRSIVATGTLMTTAFVTILVLDML